MAFFRSTGRAKLFIVIQEWNHGLPNSFGISPDIHSVLIDLFLLIAATPFVITLIAKVKGSTDLAHCI